MTKLLNLIKNCFKSQIEDIGSLQVNIKYDNEIIITDNVVNDTYHRIYNMQIYDEEEILSKLNGLDPEVKVYYDNKPCYLYIRVCNGVNTIETYCFNKMMDHLKEKYELVINALLELYVDSRRRSKQWEIS